VVSGQKEGMYLDCAPGKSQRGNPRQDLQKAKHTRRTGERGNLASPLFLSDKGEERERALSSTESPEESSGARYGVQVRQAG